MNIKTVIFVSVGSCIGAAIAIQVMLPAAHSQSPSAGQFQVFATVSSGSAAAYLLDTKTGKLKFCVAQKCIDTLD